MQVCINIYMNSKMLQLQNVFLSACPICIIERKETLFGKSINSVHCSSPSASIHRSFSCLTKGLFHNYVGLNSTCTFNKYDCFILNNELVQWQCLINHGKSTLNSSFFSNYKLFAKWTREICFRVQLDDCWSDWALQSLRPSNIKFCTYNCHNPTNNPKQLKTTFVGVVLLSVRKTTTPPPACVITF